MKPEAKQALLAVDPGAPTLTLRDLNRGKAALPAMSSSALPAIVLADAAQAGLPAHADLVVTGLLGRGGMGQVLLGQQRSLGREVAIKTLRDDRGGDDDVRALLHEARVTGGLEHPSVVPVHALGLDERGRPVMIMKRVDGVSLGDLLRDEAHEGWGWLQQVTGAEREQAPIEVLIRVAVALEFAHERGVLHRDIKPDNVLIGRYGEVYLADWGVAVRRDEPRASVAGTPAYMAPEMTRPDGELGPATDVYLLGATLHEVITGRHRHGGATVLEALREAAESAPVSYGPEVPQALARLCNEATAREPGQRPTVAAFRQGLQGYLRHAAARRLTRQAIERLDALREQMAGPRDDEALKGLHRGMVECRFAFEMALREWPDSAEAAGGRERFLREAVGFELDRGNLEAARDLLGELAPPPADLLARLEAQVARRREEEATTRAMAELARQHDPNVGTTTRLLATLLLILVVVGAVATLLFPRVIQRSPEPRDLLLPNVVITTVLMTIALVNRRRLLTSAVNRRFASVIILSTVAMLLHRLLAVHRGQDLRSMLSDDLLLLGAVLVGGLVPLGRWMPLVAVVPVTGGLIAALSPAPPLPIFGLTILSTLATLLAANLRRRAP